MKSFPRREIKRSLEKKGFYLETGDHDYYNFYHNGKKTDIWTKISRGSKYEDYPRPLLNQIKRQLKFESPLQLEAFLKCPMQHEHYIQFLKEKKLVSES